MAPIVEPEVVEFLAMITGNDHDGVLEKSLSLQSVKDFPHLGIDVSQSIKVCIQNRFRILPGAKGNVVDLLKIGRMFGELGGKLLGMRGVIEEQTEKRFFLVMFREEFEHLVGNDSIPVDRLFSLLFHVDFVKDVDEYGSVELGVGQRSTRIDAEIISRPFQPL